MRCTRCGGLMVREKFEDLEHSGRVTMSMPDGAASTVARLSIP